MKKEYAKYVNALFFPYRSSISSKSKCLKSLLVIENSIQNHVRKVDVRSIEKSLNKCQNGTKILPKSMKKSSKSRGRKKDGPKSIKIEPWNAQMWIFQLPRVFPDATGVLTGVYRGLPGCSGKVRSHYREGLGRETLNLILI